MNIRKKKKNTLEKTQHKISEKIIDLLNSNNLKTFTTGQIIKNLGLKENVFNKKIPVVINQLIKENKIILEKKRKFRSVIKKNVLTGKIDHVNPRFGYLLPDDGSEDIYLLTKNMKNAMDGDIVKISTIPSKNNKKRQGKVIEIISRRKNKLVGKIEFSPRFGFVIPDNRKIYHDIYIDLKNSSNANHNDKVIVEIIEWPTFDKKPIGKVSRVLGKYGENETEITSIMAEFDLPFEFSKQVEIEANSIKRTIEKEEIIRRRDFRNITTFTIDPSDAKDFDDAISICRKKNNITEIGIHIADVTHYVKKDTVLDKEAYHRANSVYLVDRTIPMLPFILSNNLCSLRPNEEKLTFSAVFEFDQTSNMINKWFGKTIIHSNAQLSYEQAQDQIINKKGTFQSELNILNELAKDIRKKRFENGAINFKTNEVSILLDNNKKPIKIIPKNRVDAHLLIEEFMLLANKEVAEYVYNKKKKEKKSTFVYRTHDFPNAEKINSFSLLAKTFGHHLNIEKESISKSINQLMINIEGKPEETILQQLAIRSMAKAKYTTDTQGHFGLAFKHYTHFTSPIRRYPDMMVHRLLERYLSHENSINGEEYEKKCVHSSEREKRAVDAERASIKYKQVEYMEALRKKNEVLEGVISEITDWGIFVEILDTKCEGMIRIANLKNDYFKYDKVKHRIVGARTGKIYSLGKKIMVIITQTNINKRTVDLEITES